MAKAQLVISRIQQTCGNTWRWKFAFVTNPRRIEIVGVRPSKLGHKSSSARKQRTGAINSAIRSRVYLFSPRAWRPGVWIRTQPNMKILERARQYANASVGECRAWRAHSSLRLLSILCRSARPVSHIYGCLWHIPCMNNEPVVCAAERSSRLSERVCLYFIMFTRILHHLARRLCDRRRRSQPQSDWCRGKLLFYVYCKPIRGDVCNRACTHGRFTPAGAEPKSKPAWNCLHLN